MYAFIIITRRTFTRNAYRRFVEKSLERLGS